MSPDAVYDDISGQYLDDISGQYLDDSLVRETRMKEPNVWTTLGSGRLWTSDCYQKTGKSPIRGR